MWVLYLCVGVVHICRFYSCGYLVTMFKTNDGRIRLLNTWSLARNKWIQLWETSSPRYAASFLQLCVWSNAMQLPLPKKVFLMHFDGIFLTHLPTRHPPLCGTVQTQKKSATHLFSSTTTNYTNIGQNTAEHLVREKACISYWLSPSPKLLLSFTFCRALMRQLHGRWSVEAHH